MSIYRMSPRSRETTLSNGMSGFTNRHTKTLVASGWWLVASLTEAPPANRWRGG